MARGLQFLHSFDEITKIGNQFRRAAGKIDSVNIGPGHPTNDPINCFARHDLFALWPGIHVAMHASEIAKLADIHLKNLRARAAELPAFNHESIGKSIHLSTATTAVATLVIRVCGSVVILAFGLLWMPQRGTRTIERLCFSDRYIDNRLDEFEKLRIRRLLVKIIGLVAHGVALTALHPMIVVVENFLERPTINHRLIALEACALFAFERFDGDRTKFDTLHGSPRLRIAFEYLDSVKPSVFKSGEKTFFSQCP